VNHDDSRVIGSCRLLFEADTSRQMVRGEGQNRSPPSWLRHGNAASF
jgi:hypothetical protein